MKDTQKEQQGLGNDRQQQTTASKAQTNTQKNEGRGTSKPDSRTNDLEKAPQKKQPMKDDKTGRK